MKLASKEYISQLKELHEEKKSFGNKFTEIKQIRKIISKYPVESILDYGCGKGALIEQLKKEYPDLKISGYDPGNALYADLPEKHHLVSSTDVMEHIEPDLLDNVLNHIKSVSEKLIYLEISCFPAKKHLPDGRNAHLIIEEPQWWQQKLYQFFDKESFIINDIVDRGIKQTKKNDIKLIYLRVLINVA